jgi:hypothetical protein
MPPARPQNAELAINVLAPRSGKGMA